MGTEDDGAKTGAAYWNSDDENASRVTSTQAVEDGSMVALLKSLRADHAAGRLSREAFVAELVGLVREEVPSKEGDQEEEIGLISFPGAEVPDDDNKAFGTAEWAPKYRIQQIKRLRAKLRAGTITKADYIVDLARIVSSDVEDTDPKFMDDAEPGWLTGPIATDPREPRQTLDLLTHRRQRCDL